MERATVTTEDPTPVNNRVSFSIEVEELIIGVGSLLILQPGDYFYDDDWFNPVPLRLRVSLVGEISNFDGLWFRYIEGQQLFQSGRTRARGIAVRVDALAAAARAGLQADAANRTTPRPPMIRERGAR